MFARTATAPEGVRLQALRRSLNTPVVAVDGLYVGPAAAAIAVTGDDAGGVELTLAVRSVRPGRVIFFAPGEAVAAAVGLDAAVAFAEGMGFLFDDEEIRAGRGRDAELYWREICGAEAEPLAEIDALAGVALLLTKFRRAAVHGIRRQSQ
jgi:hypothetical protein